MRVLQRIVLLMCTSLCLEHALAVDGYKDLKFGISEEDVLKEGICSFAPISSDELTVEQYTCTDFTFGSNTVEAVAVFINGKFLRFAIVIPPDQSPGVFEGLESKYGSPSSAPSEAEFNAMVTIPNNELWVGFDADTVYLKIMTDALGNESALLIYSSPEFDMLLIDAQRKSVEGDL